MLNVPDVLYKYRPNKDYALKALAQNQSWFSNREKLNDPYDTVIRIAKGITVEDVRRLAVIVMGKTYARSGAPPLDILARIEASTDPLERIGLMAEYAEDAELLELLRDPQGLRKSTEIMTLAVLLAVQRFFRTTTILSLSASATNKVLWGDYASSYAGFCAGYEINGAHSLSSRLRPVMYTDDSQPIPLGDAFSDPIAIRDKVIYTKALEWQHQREWRVTTVGEQGLRDAPLQLCEIIFGSSMQPAARDRVHAAIHDPHVRFRELRLAFKRGFELTIVDC